MNRTVPLPLTEDEIHALVDNQVAPGQLVALQARLAADPAAQRTMATWQQQRDALHQLHRQVLDEALPPALLAAAQHAVNSQRSVSQWWRWGGMAASVMLAFGIGWFSHTAWLGAWQAGPSTLAQVGAKATREFARQASFAHGVYSPEVRHPVEVAATEQEHLVQWLSKRLGKPLKVPNLSSQGFELVGGRLLPGDAGARAQFMFQNARGERITLYLGAVNATSQSTDSKQTAFSFSTEGPVPGFYWVDQGFGYALAGALPRADLLKLAEAVYQQL